MTSHDLRDLLHERVADEAPVDLAGGAWRSGRRARRRRTLGAAAGVTAGAVAVAGVLVAVDSTAPAPDPAGPRPTTTSTPPTTTPAPPAPPVEPDATYQGTPVWFGPDQVEERNLPDVEGGPFPETLDLDVRTKALVGPALAAFGIGGGRVAIVGAENSVVTLDVSRFRGVTDGANRFSSVGPGMVSPSGESLLALEDGILHIYDVSSGAWTQIRTGTHNADVVWFDSETLLVPSTSDGRSGRLVSITGEPVGEGARPLVRPGFDTTYAGGYGRAVTSPDGGTSAQAWDGGVTDLPERGRREDLLGVGFIAVDGPVSGVLTITTLADVTDVRSKRCCAVVGWLDPDTLVYETRQSEPGLIAWTVGTDEFRRVTTIEDGFSFASFADLG